MKYILIQADGMPDRPIKELKNKTPLQVANTPTIDKMSSISEVGSVNHIPKGFKSGSDVGNLSVLGYNPKKYFTGRSPLEAASIGIDLGPNDIAYRCNLINLVEINDHLIMEDYSAGHIKTSKAKKIIDYLKKYMDDDEFILYPGVSYRHILVWKEGKMNLETTPPHDILEKKIENFIPRGDDSLKINEFMKKANALIKKLKNEDSEIGNIKVSDIWLWGQGKKTTLPSFFDLTKKNGSVISAVDLVKGIGRCASMNIINVEGATGYLDTNYLGKVESGLKELESKDFLMLHIEAPDETGHEGDYMKKIQAIEDLDSKVLSPLLEGLNKIEEEYKILLVSDHPTPIELRTHSYEYVPFLIHQNGMNLSNHNFKSFSEDIVNSTQNKLDDGYKLIYKFLDL
tara:strand:+ start:1152 stop:2351 length:1200 start_codon:yes stop_codon:yes gene_type:complete